MPNTLVELVDGPADGLSVYFAGPWPRTYVWVMAGEDNLKYKVREGTQIADYVTPDGEGEAQPEYVYQGPSGQQGPPGPQGATGPAGATGPQGEAMEWKGEYNAGTIYDENDGVQYLGSSYISLQNYNMNHEPGDPGESDWWSLMALKGEQGDQGEQGEQGPAGPSGPQGADGENGSLILPYSPSESYEVGDYTFYRGVLYRANQAVAPSGGITYRGVSQSSRTTTGTMNLPLPAGTVAGDLAVLSIHVSTDVSGANPVPSGWMVRDEAEVTSTTALGFKSRLSILTKTITGADVSAGFVAIDFTLGGTLKGAVAMMRTYDDTEWVNGDVESYSAGVTFNTNIPAKSINTTAGGQRVLGWTTTAAYLDDGSVLGAGGSNHSTEKADVNGAVTLAGFEHLEVGALSASPVTPDLYYSNPSYSNDNYKATSLRAAVLLGPVVTFDKSKFDTVAGYEIGDSSSSLASARRYLDFEGDGVTVTDDASGDRVVVTIEGSEGSGGADEVVAFDSPLVSLLETADFVADAGSLSNVVVSDGGWKLSANNVGDHFFRHGTGLLSNGKIMLKFKPGSGSFNTWIRFRQNGTTLLTLSVYNNNSTNLEMHFSGTISGTETFFTSGTIASGVAVSSLAGQPIWIIVRASGNRLRGELWFRDPELGGVPDYTRDVWIPTTHRAALGAGISGGVGIRMLSLNAPSLPADVIFNDLIAVSEDSRYGF
jgi:hypothetical protein